MIEMSLENKSDSVVVYRYDVISEEPGLYGRLSLNLQNGEIVVLKKDQTGVDMFIRHAVSAMKMFFYNHEYPSKKQFAWY